MMYFAANPFIQAYLEADSFGKSIFFGLFILSCSCWILLLWKVWQNRQIKKTIPLFEQIFKEHKKNPLNLNFKNIEKVNDHPFFMIYEELRDKTKEILNKNHFFQEKQTVNLSKTDMELIESSLYHKINQETAKLDKNLFILSMVVSLGPFLGLLGTVWGILLTFSSIGTQAFTNLNHTVLSGLSMALTTTVIGLVVAIPALISYNFLKNTIRHFSTKMEDFSKQLLHTIELQYRQVDL